MMRSALKTKALIGWTKAEMEQDFDPRSLTVNDGYTTYDIARVQRFGCGLGFEVVYSKDNLVSNYRLAEFAPHSGAVNWTSDWAVIEQDARL